MKTRTAAIAVMAVFIVLVPAAAIMCSSESDAVDAVYARYYYNQLTHEQKEIYDDLESIDSNPTELSGTYSYDRTITGLTAYTEDAEAAWTALKLDNPLAVATWTTKMYGTPIMGHTDAGDFVYTVGMDAMFADVVTMKNDIMAVINAIEIKGDDVPDKADSINDILTGKGYKFKDEGANGLYGLLGDGDHELSAIGFAAVYKALADKADINAMQVYGTLADGSKNMLHAWNVVVVDNGQVYAVDSALNNKDGHDAWLLAGRYTVSDGESFGKNHLAFAFNISTGAKYDFGSELLCNDGYEWPENKGIMDILTEYAPWIFIGIICVVLALVLIRMAKKGEI